MEFALNLRFRFPSVFVSKQQVLKLDSLTLCLDGLHDYHVL